jgi:DNA primase
MKGCTFTEAMEYIQQFTGAAPSARIEQAKPKKQEETVQEAQQKQIKKAEGTADSHADREKTPPSPKPDHTYITLDTIRDQYSITLQTNQKAQEYLKSRGISIETAVTFKIGYVDGSIRKKAGGDAIAYLKETGIFTQQGNEHFNGCIVVPLTDADNKNTLILWPFH